MFKPVAYSWAVLGSGFARQIRDVVLFAGGEAGAGIRRPFLKLALEADSARSGPILRPLFQQEE